MSAEDRSLCFEWQSGETVTLHYVRARHLCGVATSCPYGEFPGMPTGIMGLVLWNGKLLPVVDITKTFGGTYKNLVAESSARDRLIFLFVMDSDGVEHALAIPGPLRAVSTVDEIAAEYDKTSELDVAALVESCRDRAKIISVNHEAA